MVRRSMFGTLILGLRMCTSKRLAAIKGISDAKVEKMKEAARKLDGHEFVTGFEYAEQRKEVFKTLFYDFWIYRLVRSV